MPRFSRTHYAQFLQFIRASWKAFPDAPGTHIKRLRAGGRRRYNLIADDSSILATVQDGRAWPTMIMLRSVQVDGQTYQVRVQKTQKIRGLFLGYRKSPDAELIDLSNGKAVYDGRFRSPPLFVLPVRGRFTQWLLPSWLCPYDVAQGIPPVCSTSCSASAIPDAIAAEMNSGVKHR